MKLKFLIESGFLQWLCDTDKYDNIILGTGKTARDLQTKLRLMDMKSSFLVGDRDDEVAGVVDYRRLGAFEEKDSFRFIAAFDSDEQGLISPIHTAVHKLLGIMSFNHPRWVWLSQLDITYEKGGGLKNDANNHSVLLRNKLPYELFGKPNEESFKIHILGGSAASSLFSYSEHSWPEYLYNELADKNCVVYSWGQTRAPFGDVLTTFLRDMMFYGADLVIFYGQNLLLNPRNIAQKNLMYIRASTGVHEFIQNVRSTYSAEKSNGIDHIVKTDEMAAIQHRIMLSLSKRFGFAFWDVLAPNIKYLPEEQAYQLTKRSPLYLRRQREKKDAMIAAMNSASVKDFTDTFVGVDNIFDMYCDRGHLTNEGNERIAKRFAADIIAAYGDRITGGNNG